MGNTFSCLDTSPKGDNILNPSLALALFDSISILTTRKQRHDTVVRVNGKQ